MNVPDEKRERLEAAAKLYEEAADELDRAAAHSRRTAEHFRDAEVPRATAHAWATRGHLLAASRRLDEQAEEHSRRSNV